MRSDIVAQLADYRGVFGWEAFVDSFSGQTRPKIEVSLYIKETTIPMRKRKMTEINTVEQMDHRSQKSTTTALIFQGAPDILQVQISGWIITPYLNGVWTPTDINGTPLPYGNVNYGEIIAAYIEGTLNETPGGALLRRDPDYYISPYGQKYDKPIIATWECQYTVNPKKQTFTAVLYLER